MIISVFRKMCTMEYFMYIGTSPWTLRCISSLNTPISQKEEHNNGCVVDKDHRFSKNKNSFFTSGKCHHCGKKKGLMERPDMKGEWVSWTILLIDMNGREPTIRAVSSSLLFWHVGPCNTMSIHADVFLENPLCTSSRHGAILQTVCLLSKCTSFFIALF